MTEIDLVISTLGTNIFATDIFRDIIFRRHNISSTVSTSYVHRLLSHVSQCSLSRKGQIIAIKLYSMH